MLGKFRTSKSRLLLSVGLSVLLAFASVQNVSAWTEIAYDDGTKVGAFGAPYLGVRFTPNGQVKIVGAKIYFSSDTASTTIYVTGPDHTTVLLSQPYTLPGVMGFQTILFGSTPTVSGDFYIIVGPASSFSVGLDMGSSGRSLWGPSLAGLVNPYPGQDLMIRALVEGIGQVVGGVVMPTNSLTVLAPYIVMIGLVATAAVAVKKRRN